MATAKKGRKRPKFRTMKAMAVKKIKPGTAASIGRTITRYSLLEYILLTTMCGIMEMSIKHARLAVRLPPPKMYASVVRDMLAVHKVKVRFSARQLGLRLEAANNARNRLAHSLLLWNEDKSRVEFQLVKGQWDLGQEFETVNRAIQPQSQPISAKYLRSERKAVEDGIRFALRHQKACRKVMDALHEKRRTQSALDRRDRGQTRNTP